jgi:hypothetical protein
MRNFLNAIKDVPHPEEAAMRPSRRMQPSEADLSAIGRDNALALLPRLKRD